MNYLEILKKIESENFFINFFREFANFPLKNGKMFTFIVNVDLDVIKGLSTQLK